MRRKDYSAEPTIVPEEGFKGHPLCLSSVHPLPPSTTNTQSTTTPNNEQYGILHMGPTPSQLPKDCNGGLEYLYPSTSLFMLFTVQSWPKLWLLLHVCHIMHYFTQKFVTNYLVLSCLFLLLALEQQAPFQNLQK